MDASIDFSGVLRGSIADGGGGGGGDTVIITPVVTSGTKIADVSVNGVEKDLYCPTPPTPPEIDITPVVTSGTKIADVSVGGVEKDLYAPNPTQVSVNQVQQSGTKIATIGVNGVNTNIYAPNSGGGVNYSTNEQRVGAWIDGKPLYRKTIVIHNDSVVNSSRIIGSVDGDHLVKYYKCINIDAGYTYSIPYVSGNTNAQIFFRDTGEIQIIISGTSFSAGSDFYITYEYTKSSDS